MEIYGLTNRGMEIARNTRSPDTPKWRVIHFLYKVPKASTEQIAEGCGLTQIQTGRAIRELKGIVAKE